MATSLACAIRSQPTAAAARAASGYSAAAPRRLMNSRRRISPPKLIGHHCIGSNEYFDRLKPGSKPLPQCTANIADESFASKAAEAVRPCTSATPPKADVSSRLGFRRFSARSRLVQCGKPRRYSITSSASCCKCRGTLRPSAFAVLRLIASSYFTGACTGRSAGFSPLRMRST
jgi:hypothetical protein